MNRVWMTATLLALLLSSPDSGSADDAADLRRIDEAYVAAWLQNDADGLLALFEADARISPNNLCPIEGLENLRAFWFPDDGSVTTIHRYEAEHLGVSVLDTLGVSTQKMVLEWSYEKDDVSMGRVQEGISTTVCRRQPDGTWKIWRRMWTDVLVRER